MNKLYITGRIFFGLGIAGIGVLHFFYPGIRPIIIPGLAGTTTALTISGVLIGVILVAAGILIAAGYRHRTISLAMGIVFLMLGLFVHLPGFLTTGQAYWVNLNKVIALSGGFLLTSGSSSRWVIIVGKCLFAIMLFMFGLGHLMNSAGLAGLVPPYIPFPQFWAFMGGVALMGSAISIFINVWTSRVATVLAAVLFIWLISLHLYYAILHPAWQEGENLIGVVTCLSFCGIALLISRLTRPVVQ